MPRRYPESHVLYRNLARDYPLTKAASPASHQPPPRLLLPKVQ